MGARLEHVIARNIAELRAERQATQPELAARMRANGFGWSTNRVTQIETLRRPVSLLEVVGLARVFGVPVSRLLAGDDEVTLPSGDTMPLSVVRDSLAGDKHVEIRPATEQELAAYRTDSEDLRKMAGKLGLKHPSVLDTLAYRVFGRSFWAERQAREGDVSSLSKRSAQTKRGHVSRALLADVEKYLGEGQHRLDRLQELELDPTTEATEGGES